MRIQIRNYEPDTRALVAWAAANRLGDPMSIRLPVTVDCNARTIEFVRVHGTPPKESTRAENVPMAVDLPEIIMSKVGPSGADLVYPAVMV